eukprot:gene18448-28470_t
MSDVDASFTAKFKRILGDDAIDDNGPFEESAAILRRLMKEQYLPIESLSEAGLASFFAPHRSIARCFDRNVSGLSVRFTVQYNLFSGTVNALGDARQREWLKKSHDAGELGCFMLTEHAAGVLSGLIVETTAELVDDGFVVRTPTAGAAKVWISQGFTAKWGVLIANLIDRDGKNLGAHGFVVDMAAAGVRKEVMAPKTAFNSLDNANVSFDGVKIPHSSLLARHCRIAGGAYAFDGPKPPSFMKIAQRLLSGRLCISDCAVTYFETSLQTTLKYCAERQVWIDPAKQQPLAEVPYMTEMFSEVRSCAAVHAAYLRHLQGRFAEAVQTEGAEPSRALQTQIAAGKCEGVEFATASLERIRRKVGSYSLMAESPFGTGSDIMFAMRFAEGDTHVLQGSIVRDHIKTHGNLPSLVRLSVSVLVGWLLHGTGLLSPAALLRYRAQRSLLGLLLFLKRRSAALGKLGAWYASGERLYSAARALSLNLIYTTAAKAKLASKADLAAFVKHANRLCAGF